MDFTKTLNNQLNESAPRLRELDTYYAGNQPAAYLSKDSRDALGSQFTALSVNFPRLVVSSLEERLRVSGFKSGGEPTLDDELWDAWQDNRMIDASAQAHTDALIYGRSFVIVWADPAGRPTVTVESPLQVTTVTDPVTRRVVAALKRWVDLDGNGQGVLYLPDEIRMMSCGRVTEAITDSYGRRVEGTDLFPADGWTTNQTLPNPFGVVPVVPIVNRGRLLDSGGVSEMRDVLGLADALNKLMADAMVTSEFYARPRRWVTGLEIIEDEDGNPINPFTEEKQRVWQSEDPNTKFGQFDPARLDGYSDLTAVVTQQIGALTGLPPHYLGLHGDQPASADAIRSAEASLVSRCYELQRTLGRAWADVAALMKAVLDRSDPLAARIETEWASPETRTPAQSADAAAKLAGIGVPLRTLLSEVLDWRPDAIDAAMRARDEELAAPVPTAPEPDPHAGRGAASGNGRPKPNPKPANEEKGWWE